MGVGNAWSEGYERGVNDRLAGRERWVPAHTDADVTTEQYANYLRGYDRGYLGDPVLYRAEQLRKHLERLAF